MICCCFLSQMKDQTEVNVSSANFKKRIEDMQGLFVFERILFFERHNFINIYCIIIFKVLTIVQSAQCI